MLQLLTPVGTVLFNAWALGVKPGYVLGWLFERPWIEIFEALALMPLAGLAIYRMRTWSYLVFFALVGWSFYRNLARWDYASQTHSTGVVIAVYALQLGLALYFFLPSVRKVYLDARVRWWESKPRYPLGVAGTVDGAPVLIENLSEGGVLVRSEGSSRRLEPPSRITLAFRVLGVEFSLPSQVMYAREVSPGVVAYGLRFEHSPESRRRMVSLARGLRYVGLAGR